jgi:pimeloyl-ACP methyl ester carboxylesterase
MASRNLQPPAAPLLALESLAVLEYATYLASTPLLRSRPSGDGHPILVLPGFTASDSSTQPLRSTLKDHGYPVHGWGLGPNVGPHPRILRGLERRFEVLVERHGQPLSLIGWSLGGIYARELARAYPSAVRQVITMASPYRFREGDRSHASDLYDTVAPRRDPLQTRVDREEARPPLPVPSTSIYTRADGVVHWTACIEAEGDRRENVEVLGTHGGLGWNVAALVVVLDRLAQPAGTWAPFEPSFRLRALYPPSVWWRPARAEVA